MPPHPLRLLVAANQPILFLSLSLCKPLLRDSLTGGSRPSREGGVMSMHQQPAYLLGTQTRVRWSQMASYQPVPWQGTPPGCLSTSPPVTCAARGQDRPASRAQPLLLGIFPLVDIAGATLHQVVHFRTSVHFRPSPSWTSACHCLPWQTQGYRAHQKPHYPLGPS
jgi:hypothetical protein